MASEKVAMISQPMGGRAPDEIKFVRDQAIEALTAKGYIVVNTFFPREWEESAKGELGRKEVKNISVAFLGGAIALMAQCDAVYFCRGWEDARGCVIEHDVAQTYGVDILYE